ncbi:MAG: redoxin domain-containing protein [bacterium]|nr:redoxin domain-containing protein [bacterium]
MKIFFGTQEGVGIKNFVSLAVALLLIGGAIWYFEGMRPQKIFPGEEAEIITKDSSARVAEKSGRFPRAKEIVSPAGFINTEGVKIADLVGKKIILVDFWTYSCINCQRTTPYLNAWYEKYQDKGLEIVGVHTPEFEFEKVYANVASAVKKFSIQYPVVLDNDYGTWNAYENRYWPRKYLIDIDGFIVFDHAGEGAYERTEQKIQELLEERMAVLGMQDGIAKDIVKPEGILETDTSQPRSPEVYFGSARNLSLGNGVRGVGGEQNLREPSAGIVKNILYLVGAWNIQEEYAENTDAGAKIIFRYQGKDLYLVASAENSVSIRVLRDGTWLRAEVGEDVVTREGVSRATIQEDRLYKLIQDTEYGEHTIEIIIESPGFKAFTFTFG